MNDDWSALRRFTQARIALGRAGHALPTAVQLEFQLAHAQARDAVHAPWQVERFSDELRRSGSEAVILETPAGERTVYLTRPDLGRILTQGSRDRLRQRRDRAGQADVALIVTNGLSSTAVERHGIALIRTILERYREAGLQLAPVFLVPNGRVALLDEIGGTLAARVAVIIVGERPGLSAADSLGIYLTHAPGPGKTDADRNCISNIRPPEGLSYQDAAARLLHLTRKALQFGISGVLLKDDSVTADSATVDSVSAAPTVHQERLPAASGGDTGSD